MIHFVYKTTHTESGKIYVGVHSTNNIYDGYLGSGTRPRNAIRKYGKKAFTRDILDFFDSREDALIAEANIVNDKFIKSGQSFNIVPLDRLEELHHMMALGYPFDDLSEEDQKLLMDDVDDAAITDCELELRRESELRHLQKHKNML